MYSNTCFPDFYLQQLAGCSAQSLNPLDGGVWGQHGHHPLMNYQYGSSFMHPFQSQALLNSSMGGCCPSHNFGGQMNFYGHPNQMIAHLLDARRGDILRNEIVYLVANNLRDVRNMDNIVRALSTGRPVGYTEVVKSVLADRIKDEKVARLLKAIATEQKLNHKVDDVINVLQSVSPAAEMQLARVNDHRRDVADRLFAKEAQSLLTHDLVSQAHLGSLGRNYGINTFGCGTFGFAGLGNTLGTPGYLNPMGSGMETIDRYGSALQQVLASGV
ncbi:hypothetical protein HK103_006320 [Boothiomyces macroporosus]|uniref:Uncharacterized protein n=1 Tax=Boothiomyces macroporosus TaxID=261099 RepID=A0AAD5UDY7_9FUNG|nr:hypothetical protein HK103_006320 [Boothiomyces macroporosus]